MPIAKHRSVTPLQVGIIFIFFLVGFWIGSPSTQSNVSTHSGSSTGGAKAGGQANDERVKQLEAELAKVKQEKLAQGLRNVAEIIKSNQAKAGASSGADVAKKPEHLEAPDLAQKQRQASIRDDHHAGKQNDEHHKEHEEKVKADAAAGDLSKPGRGLECPDDTNVDGGQIPLAHLPRKKKTSVAQKYDRRAHNCASNGIWNRVTIEDHHNILHNIVRLGKIKKNSFVLDWGSGCGHSMQFLYDEYQSTGIGIDVSSLTIQYAKENTTKSNLYCVADGTKLEWIPDGYVDNAFSFGSIYHVYNRTLFCHVIRQLARTVKIGGTVYNGWTENAEYKRDHVKMCLEDLPVSYQILEEAKEFANVKIYPLKSQQRTPNTYSLVVTKNDEIKAEDVTLENVPIVCGKHKCVKKSDPAAQEKLP